MISFSHQASLPPSLSCPPPPCSLWTPQEPALRKSHLCSGCPCSGSNRLLTISQQPAVGRPTPKCFHSSALSPDRPLFPCPPSPGPPADSCPWPPSGLQGIASFSLAVAFSSFHVPGWLPGLAEAQTWLHGNRDRHSPSII